MGSGEVARIVDVLWIGCYRSLWCDPIVFPMNRPRTRDRGRFLNFRFLAFAPLRVAAVGQARERLANVGPWSAAEMSRAVTRAWSGSNPLRNAHVTAPTRCVTPILR